MSANRPPAAWHGQAARLDRISLGRISWLTLLSGLVLLASPRVSHALLSASPVTPALSVTYSEEDDRNSQDNAVIRFFWDGEQFVTIRPGDKSRVSDTAVDARGHLWAIVDFRWDNRPEKLIYHHDGKKLRIYPTGELGWGQSFIPTPTRVILSAAELTPLGPDGLGAAMTWTLSSASFDVAELLLTNRGWLTLGASWNTCGSAGFVEGLWLEGPGFAHPIAPHPSLELPHWGADARLYYVVVERPESGPRTCHLLMRDGATGGHVSIRRSNNENGNCSDVTHNGRYTVAALGQGPVRVQSGQAVPLGRFPDRFEMVGIAPDHRGRALIANSDGQIWRFSSQKAPTPIARWYPAALDR